MSPAGPSEHAPNERPVDAASPLAPSRALAPVSARGVTEPAPVRATHLMEPRASSEPDETRDSEAELAAEPKRTWYGWQTLTADGLSLLALLASDAAAPDDESLRVAGLLGYEFAPGVLHFVHRNPGRAFASFGLRLGLPLAGAVLGAATSDSAYCDDAGCREDRAVAGLLLGMAGAIALDAAVFAYESPRGRRQVTFAPLLELSPQRAWVGVGGAL